MSGLTFDLRTIAVLWRRDLLLFFRQKSRIAGTIAQPLLFWLGIGAGMAPTFRPGSGTPNYMEYFYPGVVVLMLLMSSMSSTMGVIEDRHQGFLQGVLAAPEFADEIRNIIIEGVELETKYQLILLF